MKRFTHLLTILSAAAVLLCGCGDAGRDASATAESAKQEETVMESDFVSENASEFVSGGEESSSLPDESEASEESASPDSPAMSVENDLLRKGETLVVRYSGTDEKDWIGIYPETAEPGTINSLLWQYAVGEGECRFSTSSLEGGVYGVYLCDNDGYLVLSKLSFTLRDSDETDYGVKAASFHASSENGVTRSHVLLTPSDGKELTYLVYWSKNGKRLPGYEPIACVAHAGKDPFRIDFNDCLFMPDDADGVEIAVKQGASSSFFSPADDTLKVPASSLLYRFSVITDLHIKDAAPQHISHLRASLADIRALAPDSAGIFTVGDNTDGGTVEQYELLTGIVSEALEGSDIPIWYTLGNHDLVFNQDYDTQIGYFKKYTGAPNHYYSVESNGTKFIFLASDEKVGEGVMHAEQLDWLEAELASVGTETPVFLFAHQPLIETVSGSLRSVNPDIQYWYGFVSATERLRAILKRYPNAILFTGHTHWTFESLQPILFGAGADATFVNCASVGYLWTDDDVSTGGSEGWYVEVYEDYILLKGREFVNGTWCAAAQFRLPR